MRAGSHDGRWVVDGLENSRVTARDAKSHGKAIEFRGVEPVYAVDPCALLNDRMAAA